MGRALRVSGTGFHSMSMFIQFFAGFYYVCVELNPRSHPHTHPPRTSTSSPTSPHPSPTSSQSCSEMDCTSDDHPSHSLPSPISSALEGYEEEEDEWQECDCPETATMSGFYFHQNSEPYQQLELRHVPSESTGVFEFR